MESKSSKPATLGPFTTDVSLAEPGRARKFELYCRLAEVDLAPVGGLWQEGTTAMQLRGETQWPPDTVDNALAFWRELVME
jgi:hypothetical protein